MGLAIDKTIEQNKALDEFFVNFGNDSEKEFDAAVDLPQTTDQFYSGEEIKDVAPMIMKLALSETADEVDSRVVKFFQIYDQI